ncbi:hypothetical protein [Peribacillus frigoritolerans]|uniref:hypothetical protein n=1 Tax=Peribacillus frigoritolerans TaxID=450367 RepID=UPI000FDA15CB|nr:hypothetical protein [Peribacillus frigoritolerans]AZV62667.1 hypothetical protein DOZ91_20440 [Peribacillus frigoritolerans]
MKNKILITILIISIGFNLFLFGRWFIFEHAYEPSEREQVILSEMVLKTIESKEYKKLAEKENIIAIDANMDKNKGGMFPYYFGVSVRTDIQTYLFACSNEQCSEMESAGTTYSRYKDEDPRIPFEK